MHPKWPELGHTFLLLDAVELVCAKKSLRCWPWRPCRPLGCYTECVFRCGWLPSG